MRNRFSIIWLWLFLVPLAFDFKGDEQGSHLAQILLAVPAMGAGLALWLTGPRFVARVRLRSVVTGALCLTIFGSLVTEVIRHNAFGDYLRVMLPFLLFFIGYLAACRAWEPQRMADFERVLFYAMSASLVFSFINGIITSGNLESVRFRIVSATILCLQAMILHEFVVSRRFTKLTIAMFAGTVMVTLFSVTRSLAIGTVLLFCYATWLAAPNARKLFVAGVRAVLVAVLIGGVVFTAASLVPEVSEHWTERLHAAQMTGSGMDPTTATRLAELTDQYEQVSSSPGTMLTGMGYGHPYRYSPKYMWALMQIMTEKDYLAIRDWSAGHNFWVYQLFGGGLLFGLGLPFALLYALYRGSFAYRRWRRASPDMPYLPVLGRGLLMTASMVAMSIGGNPLGPRFSGLVFGVALGFLVAGYSRLARTVPAQSVVREPAFAPPPSHGPDLAPEFGFASVQETDSKLPGMTPAASTASNVPLLFGPESDGTYRDGRLAQEG